MLAIVGTYGVDGYVPVAAPTTQAAPAISAGDAVFAFASMLTALPHVIPFGAAAWATPGVELATAFNAANGFSVSQNFPDGLVFPKITGDLLAVVEKAAAPVAPAAVASPLTKLQRKAIAVFFTSDKVSVSEVQRKLSISYADAQTLCQSIVDLGLTDELELAPSLKRGAPAPQPAPVAQAGAVPLTHDEALDAFCHTPGIHQFVQAFVAGVRFAEHHHGIKGGQHGTE